ncbi:quinone oxidoreductase [Danxiaibacter flavus]|uniref:Quinone oxidoreductase n=1 Tax=Danxiaibacter flavus TaxID=3049108 RepID=A0ABV3ZDF9_9BACT|nr:quinone oxidoreductase [Chitinophagaceae bacterium DXS]
MRALTFSSFGGPDVLEYKTVPDPVLSAGEVLVQMKAIGLNYADIYRRKGNYHLKGTPPYIAGYEGAGIVVNANNVEGVKEGDRVGIADVPFANAAFVKVPFSHAIPLPGDISMETAAAVLLQGLTAQYLAMDSHPIRPEEVIVIHAASGGVGQILTQIAKMKGAVVIGLTTSEHKKNIILSVGADIAFNLKDNWQNEVLHYTNVRGADVVYDSVGTTLQKSIAVTRTGGTVVFYGFTGGDPLLVDPRVLMDGSKTLTGGDLWSYLTSREERIKRSDLLFSWIRDGFIKITDPVVFSLEEGRKAHEYLESGKSAGKVILIP